MSRALTWCLSQLTSMVGGKRCRRFCLRRQTRFAATRMRCAAENTAKQSMHAASTNGWLTAALQEAKERITPERNQEIRGRFSTNKLRKGKGASHIMAHSSAMPSPVALPGVSKIVAIGSGKGGVGKTTVAVNIAIALSKLGKRVGLIDADVYGPNVPPTHTPPPPPRERERERGTQAPRERERERNNERTRERESARARAREREREREGGREGRTERERERERDVGTDDGLDPAAARGRGEHDSAQ